MSIKKEIVHDFNKSCGACYFRTSIKPPFRKALLQITQRCNLHCMHCFVSSESMGISMDLNMIRDILIPRLQQAKVVSVTLTGGEPFVHPQIIEIAKAFVDCNIRVGICTNATLVSDNQLDALVNMGNVHLNVSLDGFSEESHGVFRGKVGSFELAKRNIEKIAKRELLQGILITPNKLAKNDEYVEICKFGIINNAEYILMNPLSSMGRGVNCQNNIKAPDIMMREIRNKTQESQIEIAYIRFPNDKKLPLVACEAGNIIYVFVDGRLTVCPYLVFAAESSLNQNNSDRFIVGNILRDIYIIEKLNKFDIIKNCCPQSPKCKRCLLNNVCMKGCLAAIISDGKNEKDLDPLCPMI